MKIANSKRIKEKDIEYIENKFGLKFPSEYRNFMIETNGGEPIENYLEFDDESAVISNFFSYETEIKSDSLEWNGDVLYKKRIPVSLFPIADALNDIICIGVKDEFNGKIFLWDSAAESNEEIPDFSNIKKIADSWSDFVKMLKEED